jgi:capsular polysaccharide biosynthesis protein
MSEQALDLKRSLQIVRRHWLTVAIVAALGLAAGGGYALVQPPMLASTALVRIVTPLSPTSANNIATMVVVSTSDPVLNLAQPLLHSKVSKRTLQKDVSAHSLTSGIIAVRAQGRTAAQAEDTANTVARSFVQYIGSPNNLNGGALKGQVLGPASVATGRPMAVSVAIYGVIGLLAGAVLGSIGTLAVRRRDRRLRLRDEIADSIGIPVLASIPVGHPTDAAGWVTLLTEYEPAAVDAWRLRGALHYLGLEDSGSGDVGQGEGVSLAVLSLRTDPGALALGPQLAVFAASLGIRTQLMIGPQQDPNVTATLRAACAGMVAVKSRWSRFLQVTVRDQDNSRDRAKVALTVLVAVVDEQAPRMADRMRTNVAVLAVSAGAATAEELARVAVSAADSGRHIDGILVADPDPSDSTTGRIPQPTRTTARRAPTHLTGIPTETRQWMTQTRRSQ